MNETENNIQKPKLCRLAILSPLFILFFWLIAIICLLFKTNFIPDWIILLIFIILISASIVMGILALYKIHKSNGQLRGNFVAILGIVVSIFLILLFTVLWLDTPMKGK
jgi:hypothetical protein